MAERTIALDCKSSARKGYVGSNPTPSTPMENKRLNLKLKPVRIGDDSSERDCSQVGYTVPEHNLSNGTQCPNGSGRLILRENQMEVEPGGIGNWKDPECGKVFTAATMNSPADIS